VRGFDQDALGGRGAVGVSRGACASALLDAGDRLIHVLGRHGALVQGAHEPGAHLLAS